MMYSFPGNTLERAKVACMQGKWFVVVNTRCVLDMVYDCNNYYISFIYACMQGTWFVIFNTLCIGHGMRLLP